jgi:hypothetical protein
MSGTSKSSPHSWIPSKASAKMLAPVARATTESTAHIVRIDQVRTP